MSWQPCLQYAWRLTQWIYNFVLSALEHFLMRLWIEAFSTIVFTFLFSLPPSQDIKFLFTHRSEIANTNLWSEFLSFLWVFKEEVINLGANLYRLLLIVFFYCVLRNDPEIVQYQFYLCWFSTYSLSIHIYKTKSGYLYHL